MDGRPGGRHGAPRGRRDLRRDRRASRSPTCCRRSPRRRAPSGRRRSATRRRSAATSARARPPATACRCWPPSTRRSSCSAPTAARAMPVAEFMIGVKRTARRPGELIDGGHGAAARRVAGLQQGRRPQRDGDRHRRRLPRRRRAGRDRCASPSARSAPTIVRAAGGRGARRRRGRLGRPHRRPTTTVARFGRARGRRAARPIDDHRCQRRLPAPRRRGARRSPAAPRVPDRMASERATVSEQYRLHVNGARPPGRRRLARREPAVRAARAARPVRRQGGVRAGRVRVVQRARRRRAGVLVPRAGGQRASTQPITTVEGLAEPGAPTDVQRAFVDAGAVQCGFCTPGPRSWPPTRCSTATPSRRSPRSARSCRATSAGAPATAASSRPCSGSPSTRSRRPMTLLDTPRVARRHRAASATRRRDPTAIAKVQGSFAFSSDLPIDGAAVGRDAALAAPVRPHRRRSTRRAAWTIPGVSRRHHRRRRARASSRTG